MKRLFDSAIVMVMVTLLEAGALAAFGYLCWQRSGLLALLLGLGFVYSNVSMLWHAVTLLEKQP